MHTAPGCEQGLLQLPAGAGQLGGHYRATDPTLCPTATGTRSLLLKGGAGAAASLGAWSVPLSLHWKDGAEHRFFYILIHSIV